MQNSLKTNQEKMWWNKKIKYDDLKRMLDKELLEYFRNKSFLRYADELIYKRRTEFGFEIFELDYSLLNEELKIGFGLRFNEIENIYRQIYNIELLENSLTLFIDAGNLLYFKDAKKAKFKFKRFEDVKVGAENVRFVFENYAIFYFKKYDSLAKFSELVNRTRYHEDLRGNFQFHGSKFDAAVNGIIASKILKEKETEDYKRKHLANDQSEDLKSAFKLIEEYFDKMVENNNKI